MASIKSMFARGDAGFNGNFDWTNEFILHDINHLASFFESVCHTFLELISLTDKLNPGKVLLPFLVG